MSATLRWALIAIGVVAVLFLVRGACAPVRETARREAAAELREESAGHVRVEEQSATVRHVETRTERRPDGAEVVTVVEDERSEAASVAAAVAATHAELREREEVMREARPDWRLTARAAWDLTAPRPRPDWYEGEVSRRVAGPVWLGAWVRTDRAAGVALSVEW